MFWRLRPDLVHVHWAHFAAGAGAVWHGPLIVTAWGSDIYRRDQFDDHTWQTTGRALARADLVTCDSEDLAANIRRTFGIPPTQVEVIQWGVDTDLFTPDGPDLRTELGLTGREVILSARNFTPLYNQETVVEAFAALRQKRPNAFLLMKNFRGDAQYVQRIDELIRSHGLGADVRILESVPYEEMPALYRTADVTVSIPWSDAAPMALFEAMACGSAVVVGNLPSLREWVTQGKTGMIVNGEDAAEVATAIEHLLQASAVRNELREAARSLVVRNASQHVHMAHMAEHYRRLAARAAARSRNGS